MRLFSSLEEKLLMHYTQIRALPSTHPPASQGGSAGAAIRTEARDRAALPGGGFARAAGMIGCSIRDDSNG